MEFQANPNYFDYASTAPPWKEALETFVQISGPYFFNHSEWIRYMKYVAHSISG